RQHRRRSSRAEPVVWSNCSPARQREPKFLVDSTFEFFHRFDFGGIRASHFEAAPNLNCKPHLLWSSKKLTTISRAFSDRPSLLLSTSNFALDNKRLRRKMWSKVVESGSADSGRGDPR